jgi:hypothetical protein
MSKNIENRRYYLKQSIYFFCMTENISIYSHISQFDSILIDLIKTDVIIDDDDQAILLLCSFFPSYNHFRDTLVYSREMILFKNIKFALKFRDKVDKTVIKEAIDSSKDGPYAQANSLDSNSLKVKLKN